MDGEEIRGAVHPGMNHRGANTMTEMTKKDVGKPRECNNGNTAGNVPLRAA